MKKCLYVLFLIVILFSYSAYNSSIYAKKESFISKIKQFARRQHRTLRKGIEDTSKSISGFTNRSVRKLGG